MPFIVVTGDKKLDENLRALGEKGMNRVARSSIGKGLTVIKKAIQRAVPPIAKGAAQGHQTKSIRDAIGTSIKKSKINGQLQAKAGAAVGKKRKVVLEVAAARAFSRKGLGNDIGGVGVSANNVHWYILGTRPRYTKNGAYRGRMPAEGAVKRGAANSMRQANDAIIEGIRTGIVREAQRAARGN